MTLRCRVELASLRFEDEREAFYHARGSSTGAVDVQGEESIVQNEEQAAVREEAEAMSEGRGKGEAADKDSSLPTVTLEEELMDLVAIHRYNLGINASFLLSWLFHNLSL